MLTEGLRSARPREEEPPGHAVHPTADARPPGRHPAGARAPARIKTGIVPAQDGHVPSTARTTDPSRRWVRLTLAALALFAAGVGGRPDGELWAVAYDLVLYNAVYVGAATVCASAARRSVDDRLAWWAMTLALVLGVADNLVYTLVVARLPEEPFPSVAAVVLLALLVGVGAILGHDTAQGYAVARLMPVDAFLDWLQAPAFLQSL